MSSLSMKKFYVTTPIYYINAAPHIGHAYTTVAADVLARFHRIRGREVHFLTGTDEHGLKIEQAAAAHAKTPQQYADEISDKFRQLWKHLDISHDDFIRTTEPRHERVVQELWSTLQKNGDIYKGHYEGFYCVSDETFWTEKECPPDHKTGKRLCPNTDCRRELQLVREESYYFKLSKYQQKLLDLYEKHPEFLSPAHRGREILSFVKAGLEDISISRQKVKWGVPVPGDPEHTVYVWFDALINYYSAVAGQPDVWPADVHVVGKEIYRFHSVIWPAMLMAAGLPLPAKVFAHGWWTVDGEKMSKSKGNFVDPYDITRDFGVDAFRFFLLREMPFGNDGDFSRESLLKRYNADLANDLGNLISRVVTLIDANMHGVLPKRSNPERDFYPHQVASRTAELDAAMERLDFSGALNIIWAVIGMLNERVNSEAPWKLFKSQDPADIERARVLLFDMVWCLRIVTGWIEPFMPQTAAKIHMQLGVRHFPEPLSAEQVLAGVPAGAAGKIQKGPPLFPRREVEGAPVKTTLKVALIGATGSVGGRVLKEALRRGHDVTAVARDPKKLGPRAHLTVVAADAADSSSLEKVLAGSDLVISAFNGPRGAADYREKLLSGYKSIVAATKRAGVRRLLVVGGAGSLEAAPGLRLMDTPTFPPEYKLEAGAMGEVLELLRGERELDWTFVSPSALFSPGKRTGQYRVGGEQLLVDASGKSRISMEDYAIALLDEAEDPKHPKQRYTVGY
jgi:methionyl-tRNA synthetase